jgi:hypothetical protein
MQTDGRKIHLGYFDVLNDAAVARKVAEIKYGFHQNHGSAPAWTVYGDGFARHSISAIGGFPDLAVAKLSVGNAGWSGGTKRMYKESPMTKTETFDPARLRELAQGITSGPWYNDSEGVWQVEDIDYGKWQVCNCPWPYAEDNAAFIAYCGTHASDIAALCDEAAKLRRLQSYYETIYLIEPDGTRIAKWSVSGMAHESTWLRIVGGWW